MEWKSGISGCKLCILHVSIAQVNKAPLCCRGTYIPDPVINHNRKNTRKERCIILCTELNKGIPSGAVVGESSCQRRRPKRRGLDPWVRKIPCRRKWPPTPEFLSGKFHGQAAGHGVAKSQT